MGWVTLTGCWGREELGGEEVAGGLVSSGVVEGGVEVGGGEEPGRRVGSDIVERIRGGDGGMGGLTTVDLAATSVLKIV